MAKNRTHLAIMKDLENKPDSLVSQTKEYRYEPASIKLKEGQFVLIRNVYAEAAQD